MRIGILGSGRVAQTIGNKLVELGHEVMLGTRDTKKLSEWTRSHGDGGTGRATAGSFSETAAHGEIVFNCTAGAASVAAVTAAGRSNLSGKILIDVANPLDFSNGTPPTLSIANSDSLAEQLQRTFPETHVVKALNTMNAALMTNPESVAGGDHTAFICGNDVDAKARVTGILTGWFGWKEVIDVGDITAARGLEMLLMLWVRLMGQFGSPMFNFKIAR